MFYGFSPLIFSKLSLCKFVNRNFVSVIYKFDYYFQSYLFQNFFKITSLEIRSYRTTIDTVCALRCQKYINVTYFQCKLTIFPMSTIFFPISTIFFPMSTRCLPHFSRCLSLILRCLPDVYDFDQQTSGQTLL